MSEPRPALRIVRGEPSDDELAALVAVVSGLSAASGPEPEPTPRSRWADRGASLRTPLRHGPGAWRTSAT